ncbi:vacuolar iron transporter homolog 1-like [Elaeis guineensis]|uniref:Vacuolar iron transporter n=1 Tax=Elaeis guineensis var. tenera TaxID=51953 RepID=A0A6I9QR76_ELAGV|nr:vacuolar iron transporter homolog 1-like [Elaeis guineensis]
MSGASDGHLWTTSLMMGVRVVKDDAKVMIISSLAGLVAGARSMAIGEFVSVGDGVALATGFIRSNEVRLGVVEAVVRMTLVVLGCSRAALGHTLVGRSRVRLVVGCWVAITMTFGLIKLFVSDSL